MDTLIVILIILGVACVAGLAYLLIKWVVQSLKVWRQ